MRPFEFSTLRKRLGKTQKEISLLLGVSLKAVQGYEQGWRNIPVHAERQILFLWAMKFQNGGDRKPCWEVMECPSERKYECPAWEFRSGTLCWFVNGTLCKGWIQRSWREKMAFCRQCRVFHTIFHSGEGLPEGGWIR